MIVNLHDSKQLQIIIRRNYARRGLLKVNKVSWNIEFERLRGNVKFARQIAEPRMLVQNSYLNERVEKKKKYLEKKSLYKYSSNCHVIFYTFMFIHFQINARRSTVYLKYQTEIFGKFVIF